MRSDSRKATFVWWMWLNHFVREINDDGTNYTLWVKWYGEVPRALCQAAAEKR